MAPAPCASRRSAFAPLDLSLPLQTRLLRLLRSDENSPLRCEIYTISLNDTHEYHALSYAWGSQTLDSGHFLHCGEVAIPISQTLHDYFRALLKPTDEILVPLWIDALCIDQKNDTEKSYQIPNMRHVYSRAKLVTIWLGLEDEDTLNVITLLSDLARANQHIGKIDREICLNFMQHGAIPSFEKPVWQALYNFYGRAWFKRLWTVQEEILASCRGYRCGKYIFGYDLVDAGIQWMQHYQPEFFLSVDCEVDPSAKSVSTVRIDWDVVRANLDKEEQTQEDHAISETDPVPEDQRLDAKDVEETAASPSLPAGVDLFKQVSVNLSASQSMGSVRSIQVLGTSTPLLHLLRIARTRQTSVAKDRIFALLGIADEANEEKYGEEALKLNYALGEIETYIDTARFLIQHHQSLEVLKMVEYQPGYENEALTWVPRWDVNDFVPANILSEAVDETGFTASGAIPLHMEDPDEPIILAVHGQRFDRVVYTTGIISWYDRDDGDQFPSTRIRDLYTHFSQNILSKFGVASYPTREEFRTVFAMTAIAGLDEHGRPAKADAFIKHFLHQYAVELEDDVPDKSMARRYRWHAGIRDLELDRLVDEYKGGNRLHYTTAFRRAAENRRMFLTAKGYLGLGPAAVKVDDQVCLLFGANVPYIYRNPCYPRTQEQGYLGPLSGQQMREEIIGMMYDEEAPYARKLQTHDDYYLKTSDDGTWDLSWLQSSEPRAMIGHCYVHGIMHGEAVREFQQGKRESVCFRFR